MNLNELREFWERSGSARVLLGAFVALALFIALLHPVGGLQWLIRVFTKLWMGGIRGGFVVWRELFARMPWWLLLLAIGVVQFLALILGPYVELIAGAFLVTLGVSSCLAYMYLETERDEVERGYKALHNPQKGQQLAADLTRYGPNAGIPLLIVATIAIILGFASLNESAYRTFGDTWYRVADRPTKPDVATPTDPQSSAEQPTWLHFLAYTLINFIRVVDLVDVANSYNLTQVSYVQQAKWPSSTLLLLFRTFFTMVLLQQVVASLRRGSLLWQCIADYWSQHGPIRERAAMALRQQGTPVIRPLLKSLQEAAYSTPEQRDELAQLLADVGPDAIPILVSYLRRRNENTRMVAAAALGRLQALDAVSQLSRLARDPSDAVRIGLAETLVVVTEPGAAHLSKQWMLRRTYVERRPWHRFLQLFIPWMRLSHPIDVLVQTLRTLLTDSHALVRIRAATALGHLGQAADAALADLIAVLKDRDESVRCEAAGAIGRVGKDAESVNATLVELLSDPSTPLRIAAATALGDRGAESAPVASALHTLLRDSDPGVRAAATKAMTQIGAVSDDAKRQLAAGLTSEDDVVRVQTAEVMGSIGIDGPGSVPALSRALSDPNDQVRGSAAEALGKAGPSAVTAVPALAKALGDQDNRVAALAAWALGEIGPAAKEANGVLVGLLGHVNAELRARAADALGRIGSLDLAAVDALEKACDDSDGGVRGAALFARAKTAEPSEVHDRLLRGLADSDPRVRVAAIDGLEPRLAHDADVQQVILAVAADVSDSVKEHVAASIGSAGLSSQDAIDRLVALLADDTPAVQTAAVQALGKLGPNALSAVDNLTQLMLTADFNLRRHVVRSLAMIDPNALLPFAATAINDDDPGVRVLTSAALLKAIEMPEKLVPALISALRDEEVQVRSNAALALGRLQPFPRDAIPHLIENLTNSDDGLRLHSARALARAGGEQVELAFPRLLEDTNDNVRTTALRFLLGLKPPDPAAYAIFEAELRAEDERRRAAAQQLAAELQIELVPERSE